MFSFPIRIQLNDAFFGIEDMVEHGDDAWLDRIGLDGNGALYKMYNEMSTASGNEKKTRTDEDTSDLTALITNLDESLPLTNRVLYAWDNLNLPQPGPGPQKLLSLPGYRRHRRMGYYALGRGFDLGPELAGCQRVFHGHDLHKQRIEFLQFQPAKQTRQPAL
jgi:hypothetical protein